MIVCEMCGKFMTTGQNSLGKGRNELPRSRADEVSRNGKEVLPRCRASRNSLIKL